jgi:hypothetical protein
MTLLYHDLSPQHRSILDRLSIYEFRGETEGQLGHRMFPGNPDVAKPFALALLIGLQSVGFVEPYTLGLYGELQGWRITDAGRAARQP